MSDVLPPETMVRLLRAKAGELELHVKNHIAPDPIYLAADIALVAALLADHIERGPQ